MCHHVGADCIRLFHPCDFLCDFVIQPDQSVKSELERTCIRNGGKWIMSPLRMHIFHWNILFNQRKPIINNNSNSKEPSFCHLFRETKQKVNDSLHQQLPHSCSCSFIGSLMLLRRSVAIFLCSFLFVFILRHGQPFVIRQV